MLTLPDGQMVPLYAAGGADVIFPLKVIEPHVPPELSNFALALPMSRKVSLSPNWMVQAAPAARAKPYHKGCRRSGVAPIHSNGGFVGSAKKAANWRDGKGFSAAYSYAGY